MNQLGAYRQNSQQMDIRRQGQELATNVAISNAKFRRGELDLKERQLILDNAIQKLETLKANSILTKNAAATTEINQRIEKMKNEAAGLRAMTDWQAQNPGQWPDAAIQAGAGFKPVQEKIPSTGETGVMTDSQAAKYLENQFIDKGMFGAMTGQEDKKAMVNAGMKMADSYSEGNRTQRITRAADELRKRVAQYHSLISSGKYSTEKVQNDFRLMFGFIPK